MPPASASATPQSLPRQLQPDHITSVLRELVRIDSVNPACGGSDGAEGRVVDWVERHLRDHGFSPERWDVHPGRPNLRVRIPGADDSRTLAFVTHTDTVAIKGMTIDPFGAEVRDGKLWGRGSTDAKGQVASMLCAFMALSEEKIRPPVGIELILTIDEELGFSGVRDVVARGIRPDAVVIGEPTSLDIVVAHKGTQRWWIEVSGRSAHSAKPHLGINSIHHAAHLIRLIQEDYTASLSQRNHPLLGSPTVNVSVIEGGTQVNLVPELTRILMDRRTLPGETRAIVEAEFAELFAAVKKTVPNFNARQMPALMVDPPLETKPDHPLVKSACTIAKTFGRAGEPIGVPYGTDGSKLSDIGIPTIVAGPGSIDQAHTADEFITLADLHEGALFHHQLMRAGY